MNSKQICTLRRMNTHCSRKYAACVEYKRLQSHLNYISHLMNDISKIIYTTNIHREDEPHTWRKKNRTHSRIQIVLLFAWNGMNALRFYRIKPLQKGGETKNSLLYFCTCTQYTLLQHLLISVFLFLKKKTISLFLHLLPACLFVVIYFSSLYVFVHVRHV